MKSAIVWTAAAAAALALHGAGLVGMSAAVRNRHPGGPPEAAAPQPIAVIVSLARPPAAPAAAVQAIPAAPGPLAAEAAVPVVQQQPAGHARMSGVEAASPAPRGHAGIAVPARLASPPRIEPRPAEPVSPVYPVAARRRGLEGAVRCRILVDGAGAVASAEVIASSGHRLLDRAATRALLSTLFEPAREGGRVVPGETTITVRFVLDGVQSEDRGGR